MPKARERKAASRKTRNDGYDGFQHLPAKRYSAEMSLDRHGPGLRTGRRPEGSQEASPSAFFCQRPSGGL
jgi:hypothetical protein